MLQSLSLSFRGSAAL